MKISYLALLSFVALFLLGSYISSGLIDFFSSKTTNKEFLTAPIPIQAGRIAEKVSVRIQKDNSDLRRDFALLKGELTMLQRKVQNLQTALDFSQNENEGIIDNLRKDPIAKIKVEEEYQELMATIETEFLHEPSDQQWSDEVYSAIEEAVSRVEIPQSALLDVQCRSRTCRVELANDDSENLKKDLPLFIQRVGRVLPNVRANYIDDESGAKMVVLYMSLDE